MCACHRTTACTTTRRERRAREAGRWASHASRKRRSCRTVSWPDLIMVTVAFYYSIGSRYSYLSSTQLASLESDTGGTVEWHPVNSVELISRRSRSPFDEPPVSGQYDWSDRELDAKRWAEYYQVPFVEPRGRVEFDSQVLALACTAAKRLGHIEVFSRQLFAAMFSDRLTKIDIRECVRRAECCGIPSASFRRALDDSETAKDLEATIERALGAGVFGVPTFVVGTELFWGNDRLVLLRNHLKSKCCEPANNAVESRR